MTRNTESSVPLDAMGFPGYVALKNGTVPGLDEVELTDRPPELITEADESRVSLLREWYPKVRSWKLPPEPESDVVTARDVEAVLEARDER